MKHFLLILVGCTCIAGCTQPPLPPQEEPPPPPAEETPPAEDPLSALLDGWLAQWREQIPGLTLENFTVEREESFAPDVTGTIDNPEEFFSAFQIRTPSPDGTRTLAVSSGAEPDSQVLLIDAENRFERLLFCGTPCSWNDAGWVNNTQFYVAGAEERDPLGASVAPVLYLFDRETGMLTVSYGPAVAIPQP